MHEQVHWLLLISANILADPLDAEVPMIPNRIMDLCLQEEESGKLESIFFRKHQFVFDCVSFTLVTYVLTSMSNKEDSWRKGCFDVALV